MKVFHPGDIIKCIDRSMPEGPYEVAGMSGNYVKIKLSDGTESGGFFPRRFKLDAESQATTKMDSQEYEDILTGEEIYTQLKDGA